MARAKVEDIRNVALCGHGSTGKTTLVDKMLVKTGKSAGTTSVDEGSSICDFDPEEKHHKYTIESSVVHFEHAGKHFHVIDTPGYPDFLGQTLGALYGVDLAVIVINAQAGIEVNTRRVFEEAGKIGLGRMIVLNKMDAENIDFPALLNDIQELWGKRCVLLDAPLGHGGEFRGVVSTLRPPEDASGALVNPREIHEPLVESIIEADEAVMERYFEGQPPSDEELSRLIVRAIVAGTLAPIVCCSGKTDVGVAELLDALAACGPSPADLPRTAVSKSGEQTTLEPDPDGPLVARVFKTRIDPFVQKLSFLRIYSGRLKRDDVVAASSSRKGVKLGPPLRVLAAETELIDEAGAGQIVAVAKMEELHTGTTLGEYQLPAMNFPTPMVGLAVSPKSRGDETKLSGALHKVVEEDPTFRLDRDAQTKELVVTGMSELHLTIIRERLQRRDKLEVETKEPKIPYRETIQGNSEEMYRHEKQTGGRGQFAEVHVRMRPLPRGTEIDSFATKEHFPQLKSYHYDAENNFLWIDSVVGGVIPGNFMPAIEKGFRERMTRGVIAGYHVQDLCLEVFFGKYHEVDSSETAFRTAASMVFRNAFQKARPSLLEPIVKLEVTVPGDNVGDVYSDMSGRRGRVLGSEAAGGGMQTVRAEVPLMEITTYARTLSSMTSGQGSYAVEFSHYDVVPPNVQQEIIAKAKMEEVEED